MVVTTAILALLAVFDVIHVACGQAEPLRIMAFASGFENENAYSAPSVPHNHCGECGISGTGGVASSISSRKRDSSASSFGASPS
ncbi:hypothetical protein [Rhodoglobus aureus]|uniref:hypothetical protein n=1 Tax=Rhodoglobus aureus TaxID=191497 RepID=UPI0031D6B596